MQSRPVETLALVFLTHLVGLWQNKTTEHTLAMLHLTLLTKKAQLSVRFRIADFPEIGSSVLEIFIANFFHVLPKGLWQIISKLSTIK